MKGLKYITGCSLTLLLLAACNKEEGPSIDDYFLNYEIPEIPVTEDYQVGIFPGGPEAGRCPWWPFSRLFHRTGRRQR